MKFKIPKLFRVPQSKRNLLPVDDRRRIIEQPKPFNPNWQRYCPQLAFPSYRHVPGVTPHPNKDPQGHSYGLEANDGAIPPPEAWRENEDYLYGVDLYNFAYWWEAHEAWEGLWRQAEADHRLFLQGLIQISAALIKYHMRMLRPLRTLSTAGRDKLHQVLCNLEHPMGIYMGINMNEFLTCIDTFFEPFFLDVVSDETYERVTVKPLIRLCF